ncbi:AraC family transcriptional regulator [Victivallis sp. Marseille-Q1083]|uniref:helix-turn-helix transcriptional regulator n=1 Tax=Victivallis sp. Marseille-Q1083 TaxID=2717288 RepID=UPI00158CCEF9|nr:AraC family transcriptional regulator [Victivallis sp. Marseille-Q1083]
MSHDYSSCEVQPQVNFINYQSLAGMLPVWSRRRLNDFELILVRRGRFRFRNHETQEEVIQRENQVLTILPGELHTYELLSGREEAFFSCIHLELMPGGSWLNGDYGLTELPARLTAFEREEEIGSLFLRASRLKRRYGRYSRELLCCVVKEIWLCLVERRIAVPQRTERFKAMLQFLHENLLSHPGREELARHFRLSPQQVNMLFKRELGLSPGEYVRRELMEQGYQLLHYEQLSVKETAERLNFGNQFYFSKVFKKIFGVPPSKS